MEDLNLVLTFRLAGYGDRQVRGAARISVDGRGNLTVYEAGSGVAESLDLTQLRALSIQRAISADRVA